MTILPYQTIANLEQSLADFLSDQIANANLQVLDNSGNAIDIKVRIGNKFDSEWTLPTIQVFHDSNPTAPRLEIGSDKRDRRYLLILDIRANNELNRINLADWVSCKINNGFPYFEYTPNATTPAKLQNGNVGFDFVTDTKVNLGFDADLSDKYRHRISISCWISRTNNE